MKICGLHSGHDCSFAVLDNGISVIHHEAERFNRVKMLDGDSVQDVFTHYKNYDDIKYFVHTMDINFIINKRYPDSYKKAMEIAEKNNGKVSLNDVGHHQAHAANAFYSSNYDKALIITIDGGGRDINMDGISINTTFTIWNGSGSKIEPLMIYSEPIVNLGGLWYMITGAVFDLSVRSPGGGQQGSVMAMAAFGDKNRYYENFIDVMSTVNIDSNPPPGAAHHSQWNELIKFFNAEIKNTPNKGVKHKMLYDIAASLQKYTEEKTKVLIDKYMDEYKPKYVCLSGGVVLNSVMLGKFYEWYPHIEELYMPPAPYDAGCAMGAAQYFWHHILDNSRIKWKDSFTPYTGLSYGKKRILEAISKRENIAYNIVDDDDIIEKLNNQRIISVYGGRSETGKRALGNRSILCDPRNAEMKDYINEKVKHRQWFRPFAPSILREDVKDWFVQDKDSPYMFIVLKFKEDMKNKVPAVVHKDGTARLQTVTRNDNKWYYDFLKKWKDKTGIPILLNTSFNDREPIVETPENAINCFLNTEIDYLYFYDYQILVERTK